MGHCGCNDSGDQYAWAELAGSYLLVERYPPIHCNLCGGDSEGKVSFAVHEFTKEPLNNDWLSGFVREWQEDGLIFLGKVINKDASQEIIALAERTLWFPEYVKLRRLIKQKKTVGLHFVSTEGGSISIELP